MGASLSWLAVRGKSRQTVCAELGLRASSRREVYPHSPVTGAALPDGWYLIVENHRLRNRIVRDSVVARLSTGCEVITCSVEEHVMCSEAAGWKDGVKKWSVIHDAEVGNRDLKTNGEMPAVFDGIRDRLTSGQPDEADYCFEVPVELAESFTGFRHDAAGPALTGARFEVFVAHSFSRIVIRGILGLLILLLGPIGHLRALATPRGTALETTSERAGSNSWKNFWNFGLAVFCLGAWMGISFGLFRLVWLFHVWLYPDHQSHNFWGPGIRFRSFAPSFVMVFASVPGSLALALALGNWLAWRACPCGRSAQIAPGEDPAVRRAIAALLKFGFWTLSGGLIAALVAASWLKSLR